MYPNPQDVLPLPPRPDVAQYRRRAKDLLKAHRSGIEGLRSWSARWVDALAGLQPEASLANRDAERYARDLADFAHERLTAPGSSLARAQFVLARAHGFSSWTRLVRQIESLRDDESPEAGFERAADAVVTGDLPGLASTLARCPELIRARSTREHGATLLHYVAANGVENYRQRTPANIVAIVGALLDAGAEIDAGADVYGGDATTLGLAATSAHPRAMGVQIALLDILLERGARLNPTIVRDCLANGCPEAAAHLADRGAPLGLVEAAGIGRLDALARFLASDGSDAALTGAALIMTAWYDQSPAAQLLLDHGVPAGAGDDGRTALHVAAYQGHATLARLLLDRGAPVDATDDVHGTTPLVWALHAWLVEGRGDADAYRDTLRVLLDGGARVDPAWIEDDQLRADPEILALLAAVADSL